MIRVSALWCIIFATSLSTSLIRKSGTDADRGLVRRRRAGSLTFTGGAITAGLKAMEKLLKGSNKVTPTGIMFRDFLKYGDYRQAKIDFYSVKPSNVRESKIPEKMVETKLGDIGDRTLFLTNRNENGNPVIEIMRFKETGITREFSGARIDRIIYLEKKPKLRRKPKT